MTEQQPDIKDLLSPDNEFMRKRVELDKMVPNTGFTAVQAQVELDTSIEALEHAKIDPVTGLPNRVAFDEEYPSLFHGGPERRSNTNRDAVGYIDVNGLKSANYLGHHVGDALLRRTAEEIKETLRKGDKLFRIGGDEFAVFLHDVTPETQDVIKEKIKVAGNVAALNSDGIGVNDPQGVSVGIAVKRDGDTPETLLRMADIASETDKQLYKKEFEERNGVDYSR